MQPSTGALPMAATSPPGSAARAAPPARRPPRALAVRARVAAAFEAAIAEALEAAARVERDPVTAVHEFRKATRRAKAVFAAVANGLPAAPRRRFDVTLDLAIRGTGELRDGDVLPAALAALPARRGTEEARARLESELAASRLRRRRPLARVSRLAVAAARLGQLPAPFADELPADLGQGELDAGLARLVRRARKAIRRARRRPDDVALAHRARRRLRLVALALTALCAPRSRLGREGERLSKLSTRFGEALDLELLAAVARRRAAHIAARGRARLQKQLERKARKRRAKLLARAAARFGRRRLRID